MVDTAQGMIGWPAFQTKYGKTYDLAWAPGGQGSRRGSRWRPSRRWCSDAASVADHAYAIATRATAPAPSSSTLWWQRSRMASGWVEVHAGIDINRASLTLPSVSL